MHPELTVDLTSDAFKATTGDIVANAKGIYDQV